MPDPVTQLGEEPDLSRWRKFLKNTGSFFGIHPQTENLQEDSEDSDVAYRRRLLKVYEKLKKADAQVASLPEWVTGPLKDEDLKDNPHLQAVLAACTAYTPSKWLLEKELSRRDSSDPIAYCINNATASTKKKSAQTGRCSRAIFAENCECR